MDTLAPEIIQRILSYLDPDSLCAVSRVAKEFNDLANSLIYREFTSDSAWRFERFSESIAKEPCPSIENDNAIDSDGTTDLHVAPRKGAYVRSITLTKFWGAYGYGPSRAEIIKLLSSCPNLVEFVYGRSVSPSSFALPGTGLSEMEAQERDEFEQVVELLGHLERLRRFGNNRDITNRMVKWDDLVYILQRCPRLVELDFFRVFDADIPWVTTLPPKSDTLAVIPNTFRYLSFEDSHLTHETFVRLLSSSAPDSLATLRLVNVTGLSEWDFYDIVAKYGHGLEELVVHSTTRLETMRPLPSFVKAKLENLDDLPCLAQKRFEEGVELDLERLKVLELGGTIFTIRFFQNLFDSISASSAGKGGLGSLKRFVARIPFFLVETWSDEVTKWNRFHVGKRGRRDWEISRQDRQDDLLFISRSAGHC